jgi:hypothetical protein
VLNLGTSGSRANNIGMTGYGVATGLGALASGSENVQNRWGLEPDTDPDEQEYAALSPEQRAQSDAYTQSAANDLAASTPGMTAQQAKEQTFRNTMKRISQGGWKPLTAGPSRPLNYLADSKFNLDAPELAGHVGAADQLSQQWLKHLEPQLAGELDAARQSGKSTPELQARFAHYKNAIRHNVLATMTGEQGPTDNMVPANFIREHLPEQHREGFSNWMSGKAGPNRELVDSLHDVRTHYNIANKLGWTKAMAKPTAPLDVNNLWAPPAAPAAATPAVPPTAPPVAAPTAPPVPTPPAK